MATAEKERTVEELTKNFSAAQATFVINYQGCTCVDLTKLKKDLRPTGANFAVIKNTLAKRSIKGSKVEGLSDMLSGPTAVVWADKDIVSPAKCLKAFAVDRESFKVKGGFVDGAVVDAKAVAMLADMPSREELFAKLLALINAPATRLLQTINAPAGNLACLLKAWENKLAEQGE